MCGIFAVIHVATPTCLDKMMVAQEILTKRGPDSSRMVVNAKEFLSFKRLAIVDTSTAGNQPFLSDDCQVAVMCNGEIYNFRQLIEKHGLTCSSASDCEVLLRLYEKVGFKDMVGELDGVFAIVLRDYRRGFVYVARDYIGVRPLFQGVTVDGSPAFASLASALLPFCTHVKQFPASHYMELDLNTLAPFDSVYKYLYNRPPTDPALAFASVRHLLFQAVKKRLQGDRPVACLLSGGLDSSVVAFILKQLHPDVRTYSVGMRDPLLLADPRHRSLDCRYAEEVAAHLGTHHTEVSFTPEEGFAAIPEVIAALESYDITTVRASVPMYLLAKHIKAQSSDTVIFSGEGSDELFGGYLYFKKAPSLAALLAESTRLLAELPYFDVLRADRCVSSHGLEVRVPFLDIQVLAFAASMGEAKWPHLGVEKYHLRTCFEGDLPPAVLWRRKDGLSDGCSGVKTWASYITEFVAPLVSDEEMALATGSGDGASGGFPSKEALYYHRLFRQRYPSLDSNMPHYWMPRWVGSTNDPSGRLVEADADWQTPANPGAAQAGGGGGGESTGASHEPTNE